MYPAVFFLYLKINSRINKHETKKNTFSHCRTGVNADASAKIQKILRSRNPELVS